MTSSKLVGALEVLQPFVYGGLFLVALIQWRRRPGSASAWLVATFGVLAAVVVAGQLLPESSEGVAVEWATRALLATLVLFPYLLYRFTTSLVRPIRWVNVAGTVLTASLSIIAFILPPFPEQGEPTPIWLDVYVVVLLVQWVFLSGAVAVRLWRAGKAQPTVARRRMRTMSIGAMGLALALVLGGNLSAGGATDVVVQLLVLLAAPLMLIGFAPPRMLRAAWRQHERDRFPRGRSLLDGSDHDDRGRTDPASPCSQAPRRRPGDPRRLEWLDHREGWTGRRGRAGARRSVGSSRGREAQRCRRERSAPNRAARGRDEPAHTVLRR